MMATSRSPGVTCANATRGPSLALSGPMQGGLGRTMCGRAKLEGDISQIKIAFRLPPDYPTPNFAPSWNVAPTDNLPIVRYNPKAGHRTLDLMRWGLIPYWAKDIKIGFSTINAMAETVDSKPVFREAFKRRRCIVPVDSFYEWKKLGPKEKQPYAIALA